MGRGRLWIWDENWEGLRISKGEGMKEREKGGEKEGERTEKVFLLEELEEERAGRERENKDGKRRKKGGKKGEKEG